MQRGLKIPKDDTELLCALRDYLFILNDEIDQISLAKEYRIRTVAAVLRLLICDKANGGGLLVRLVEKYQYQGTIKCGGKEISLEDFRNQIIFSQSGPEGNFACSRCTVISNYAQQDGAAHEDTSRTVEHFSLNAVLELGKGPKTNPKIGFFISIASMIYNFGKAFLEHGGYS